MQFILYALGILVMMTLYQCTRGIVSAATGSGVAEFAVMVVVLGLVLGVSSLFALSIGQRSSSRSQRLRNMDAQVDASMLLDPRLNSSGEESPLPGSFILYLRPFASDGKILAIPPWHQEFLNRLLAMGMYTGTLADFSFEDRLRRIVRRYGRLFAIGEPDHVIGAGRVSVEEGRQWEDYFRRLALGARAILVVPGLNAGIQWELDWLRENELMSRVVLLLRGTDDAKAVHALLRERGWYIPPDTYWGDCLTFDSGRRLRSHFRDVVGTRLSPNKLREALEQALVA